MYNHAVGGLVHAVQCEWSCPVHPWSGIYCLITHSRLLAHSPNPLTSIGIYSQYLEYSWYSLVHTYPCHHKEESSPDMLIDRLIDLRFSIINWLIYSCMPPRVLVLCITDLIGSENPMYIHRHLYIASDVECASWRFIYICYGIQELDTTKHSSIGTNEQE